MISKKLFTHLRRRGVPVWFLGINNEEDLLMALDYGATGVLTDKIEWLSTTLEKLEKTQKKVFSALFE
jgi:hypothetical protein